MPALRACGAVDTGSLTRGTATRAGWRCAERSFSHELVQSSRTITALDARSDEVELMSRRSVELGVSMTRPVSESASTWSWRDAGSRRGPARNAVRPSNSEGGSGTCSGEVRVSPYAFFWAIIWRPASEKRFAAITVFAAALIERCEALCETSSWDMISALSKRFVEIPGDPNLENVVPGNSSGRGQSDY